MGGSDNPEKTHVVDGDSSPDRALSNAVPLEQLEKSRWERSWPTIACGAGLFSDGYLNGHVITLRTTNELL